jgi:hypothetical protein
MELLDGDEKKLNPSGQTLGVIGAIFYGIAALACLYGTQGCWEFYTMWFHLGSFPNEIQGKNAVETAMHGQLAATFPIIIGFICQRVAYVKYKYSPMWMWHVLIFSSVSGVLASFILISPIILILSILNLIHLFRRKKMYFEFVE